MKDWLEAVKEKLQEANSPLPDGELEILKGIIRRRKTKRILSLASALSAVAVLALVIVLTIGGEENTQKYLAQDACKSPNEVETITSLPHPASFIHPRKPQGVTPNLSKELVVPSKTILEETMPEPVENKDDSIKPSSEKNITDESDNENRDKWADSENEVYFTEKHRRDNGFSVSVSVGGNATTPDNSDGIAYSGSKLPSESKKPMFHKPKVISLGLALRFPLTNHLDLSSGLTYYSGVTSVLTVKTLNGRESQPLVAEQKIHYVGIPLHLDWYLLKSKRFSMYVGAGGEAKKCVYARQGEVRLKDESIYFSAIALAGLKYEPIRHIGFFVEPQYSYSFLPEDPVVKSVFTEYKSYFNVKVGISFDLPALR